MTEPTDRSIPQAELDRAHRRPRRHVCAGLVAAMSETEVGSDELANRLGVEESVCRRWFMRLMEGSATDLRHISDLAYAMNCTWNVTLFRLERPAEAPPTDEKELEDEPIGESCEYSQ